MVLSSPTSRLGIVNLISDFILKKIPHKEISIIQVSDCENFFVIKGKTSYKEVLSLNEILDEIKKKYPKIFDKESLLSRTIDLIEYGVELHKPDSITIPFYNTKNCIFSTIQIEKFEKDSTKSYSDDYNATEHTESLFVSSCFPHGYSLDSGRSLYYFGKFIVYNLPKKYLHTKLTLTLSENKKKFVIFDNFSGIEDDDMTEKIKSSYKFDLKWLEKEMKKVDWCLETTDPLSEHKFLLKN